MTGSIGFQSALINSANFFVAALYDPSTSIPTLLESIQVPKSGGIYPPDFQVTFLTNLTQDKVYRCILWESPDATPTGVSRVSGDFKASLNTIKLRGDLYLTADVSAGLASGTSGYVDPTSSLVGWIYDLEQVGYGTLEPGAGKDYTLDGTTNDWTLINGSVIANLMKFVIHFQPQVSAAAQPPISAISSGRIITASENLTNSSKNKALYIQSATPAIVIGLPAIGSVADYDHVVLYSFGGSHINAVVNTNGTDKIQLDTQVTQVILGQAEKLDLFKANGVWNVDYLSPSFWLVGQYIYRPTKGEINTIFGDGSLLLRANYPRLTNYVLTRVLSTSKIAEASWANTSVVDGTPFFPNKAKWTEGDGSTTIRVPLLYDSGFLRAVDGITRFPGSQQMDALLDFQMDTLTGDFPGNPNGAGSIKLGGGYNNTHNQPTDLTSHPGKVIGGVFTILTRRDSNETRPVNTGAYLSICS